MIDLTPHLAYHIGLREGPCDDTRAAACRDSYWAVRYARDVDQGPHEDTRAAARRDPEEAYRYAWYVDRGAHDDTREAACGDPKWGYYYAVVLDSEEPITLGAIEAFSVKIVRSVGVISVGCKFHTLAEWAARWGEIAYERKIEVSEEEAQTLIEAATSALEVSNE